MDYRDHDRPLFGKQQGTGIELPICSNTSPFPTCLAVVTVVLASLVMGCGKASDNDTAAKPPDTGQPDMDGPPAKRTDGDSEPATTHNGDSEPSPPTRPSPKTFEGMMQQRAQLDNSVWATERLAQRYEQVLVRMWDDLLAQARLPDGGDKYKILAEVPFRESIKVARPGGDATSYDLGIKFLELDVPGESMDRAAWSAFVENFRRGGYQIIQSDWHHAKFTPHDDGTAESTVTFAMHVTHPERKLRVAIDGEIDIQWTTDEDQFGKPLPQNINARKLRLFTRTGTPAFQKVATIDPSTPGKPQQVHPVLLHDLDGDGLSEILLEGCNRLYRNQGECQFQREQLFDSYRKMAPVGLLADLNGDAIVDYLSVDKSADLLLYKGTADGGFTPPSGRREGRGPLDNPQVLAAGDIDNDGDLDLWVAQYLPSYTKGQMPTPYYDANDGLPSFLLLNDGKGGFQEATEPAGLAKRRNRRTFAASFVDLDDDVDLDLVVVSDFAGVDIYLNDGEGKFTDGNSKILGDRFLFGMSTAFADFNLDGRMDFYVAGMASTTARRLEHMGLGRTDMPDVHTMRARMGYGNRMYMGTSDGFVEPEFKDQVARTGWTWGMTPLDFDNDGDRDIFAANGHASGTSTKDHCTHFWCHDIYTNSSQVNDAREKLFSETLNGYLNRSESWDGYQKNPLLMNLNGRGFMNISFLMGVADQFDSRAVVSDDLDADGRMDLLVTEDNWKHGQKLHVYRNILETGHNWIGVKLREEGVGRSPIGAKITLRAPGANQFGHIVSGETISAQHAPTMHFGLGNVDHVDAIEVRWPDGTVKRLDNPQLNQYHTVLTRD